MPSQLKFASNPAASRGQVTRRLRVFVTSGLLALVLPSPFSARAEKTSRISWTGYLVDLACARERKDKDPDLGASHTKKCMQMPSCDRGGFGLLTDTRELLRFDEEGNRKLRALIAHSKQENGFRAVVQGTRTNDVLHVTRIALTRR